MKKKNAMRKATAGSRAPLHFHQKTIDMYINGYKISASHKFCPKSERKVLKEFPIFMCVSKPMTYLKFIMKTRFL